MMSLSGILKRGAAVFLTISYLGTQCLFAYQTEKGFWAERRKATRRQSSPLFAAVPLGAPSVLGKSLSTPLPPILNGGTSLSPRVTQNIPKGFLLKHASVLKALSPAYGSVRKVTLGQKRSSSLSPVVIHIQDVHMNQEAQWNIRETVRSLLDSGQVDLLALEGATQPIDLQPFVDYPHRKAVKLTADFLLKENKISGPIHAALTAQGKLPRILGIDDPLHYEANVQAYRDSAPKIKKIHQELRAIQEQINGEKKAVFSPALQDFDQKVQAYREERSSLGAYVGTLVAQRGNLAVPKSIRQFEAALEVERELDFKRVEAERAQLIEVLTPKLSSQETNALLDQSIAYRSGQIRYADFYSGLKETCRSKGIQLSAFPAMDAYVRYVLLAEGIDGDDLLRDLSVFERNVFENLTATVAEKELVRRSAREGLIGKLVDFSLTPSEWKEYEAISSVGNHAEFASFESFYREAAARDGAMATNILQAINEATQPGAKPDPVEGGPVVLLVTGGYHAEGITSQLTHQGMTVISFVPKIVKVETHQGAAYLSVFTQEKTPLEKLFTGKKLFLAFNPVAGREEAAVVVPAVDRIENITTAGVSQEEKDRLEGYINKFHPGMALVLEDPLPINGGGWMGRVRVRVNGEEKRFTLTTNKDFEIQSFGVIEKEVPPMLAWFVDVLIPVHQFLQGYAGKVSAWTEAFLFSTIRSWTPANYLWFARKHKVETPQELSFLFAWMAIHSIQSKSGLEKRGWFFDFMSELKMSFGQHQYWNALGLIPLAVNKKKGEEFRSDRKKRQPPSKGYLGFKELERIEDPQGTINGQQEVVGRLLVVSNGGYLVLKKKVKGTKKIHLDIPGGGAAGEEAGVSLPEGLAREAKEEIRVDLRKYLEKAHVSPTPGIIGTGVTYYRIPGPNNHFNEWRTTTFSHVVLKHKEAFPIEFGSEHVGSAWMSLPQMLKKFSSFNTGPKMGVFLEFLREAYGMTGVRSLIPLNEDHRLKRLTDPVLIETDKGWFLFSARKDAAAQKEMKKLYAPLEMGSVYERRSDPKSHLHGWKNPIALLGEGVKTKREPMVMRTLIVNGTMAIPLGQGDEDKIGAATAFIVPLKRSGSLRTRLLEILPKGEKSVSSIRILVKSQEKDGPKYGFVSVHDHKDECLGVMGNETPAELIEQLRTSLEIENPGERFGVSESPLMTHSIDYPDGVEYRAVHDGVYVLLGNAEKINGIRNDIRWLTFNEMKAKYHEFTLSARMAILKEVIKGEYGFSVKSIKPLAVTPLDSDFPLLLETDEGTYVLRRANIEFDKKSDLIAVKKRADGTNGFWFQLGEENFVLVKSSKDPNREVPPNSVPSLPPPLPQGEIPLLRGLAQRIQNSSIWAELLAARESIAQQKRDNPEVFSKPDDSPVTKWDFRLQLAFLKIVKKHFPSAHVVGEEDLLNDKFLDSLSEKDREEVKDLLLKNGVSEPDGFLFFVDPIDGTRSFTEGKGNNFSFTFGVLKNGHPLYAATYLPDSKDLYEADAVKNLIYKNGKIVSPLRNGPFNLLKVQRALKAGWNGLVSRFFQNVNNEIPSIALVSAHMAAGEPGAPSELILNPKIHPWDSIPAAIFLKAAGFTVTTHKGRSFFQKVYQGLQKGVSPKELIFSLLAAREPSLTPLVFATRSARQFLKTTQSTGGRATGWMGAGIVWGMGWVLGVFGKWLGKLDVNENPSAFAKRFVAFNQGINASRAEDGVNALVAISVGWVAGQAWMGLMWAPSLVLVGIWFLVFVASHYDKKNDEGGKTSLEKLTGLSPSYRKAVQLFGFYLLPLLTSTFMGVASVPFYFSVLVVFLYFPLIRRVHDQINEENGAPLGAWGTYSNFLFPASAVYWYARWSGKDAAEAHGIGLKWIILEWISLIGLTLMAGLSSGLGTENVLGFNVDPVLGSLALLGHFAIAWGRFDMMARVEKMQGESPPAVGSVTRYLILFGLFLVPGGLFIGFLVNLVVAILQWDADARVPSDKTPWSMELTRKGYRIHLIDSEHAEGKKDEWLSVRAVISRVGSDGKVEYLLVENKSGAWEFPGGGGAQGEDPLAALRRELIEELGEKFGIVVFDFIFSETHKDRPLFVHDLGKPDGTNEYRSVHVNDFPLKKHMVPSVRLNEESRKLRWLSYERMKIELPSFTLATRMSFLPHLFVQEFGVADVTSMTPLPGYTGGSSNQPLLVKTNAGEFVFRKAGRDVPEAVFNAAVQSHLFENGIPVRELIKRKVSGEREGDYVLRLGNVPFVLERYGDEGDSVKKSDAQEKHYIALGGLAAQVQNILRNFPINLSPDQNPPRFEEMLNPSVVPGLSFWNVGFSENADGSVFVSRIRELDHPHWADRFRELENIAFEVDRDSYLQELITAYSFRIVPELTEMEIRSLDAATKNAVMRETFENVFAAKKLADEWIRIAKMPTPSTLSWIWANLPTHKSYLDDLLRKAPWESVFLAAGLGGTVAAHLLIGASMNWVLAWIIFAGVLGYSHTWGTFDFVGGQLGSRSGLPAMEKALSWLVWTSVLGAVLMGLGQFVPMELLPWVLGVAIAGAAWVGKVVHQRGNREWVVRHLDNGNLTPLQRDMAREILRNLEKRPIRLGVEEFRAMVLQTAEVYYRRAGRSAQVHPHPLPGPFPRAAHLGEMGTWGARGADAGEGETISLWEGIKLYFVDPVAVRSEVGLENLQSIMKNDGKIFLVAQNAIAGVPSERVIVVGGAFHSVGGKEKPLFEVALGAVKSRILDVVKGQPIRILKTPLLNLNAAGLASDDSLVVASKNAFVLILESLRGFPSDVVHWDDVWQVYRALAEAA